MRFHFLNTAAAVATLAVTAFAGPTTKGHPTSTPKAHFQSKGQAAAYPWVFNEGTDTSQKTAVTSAEEILQKANYASIPGDAAKNAWASAGLSMPSYGNLPSKSTLKKYGRAAHVKVVLYGSVSWHTRSIWVNAGPKTISTATVNAYVFDVASGKVVYKKTGVEGRSDEKENAWKVAADVLITPLVTVVSGGPKTPQEQRAVQIGLGRALHDWVHGK